MFMYDPSQVCPSTVFIFLVIFVRLFVTDHVIEVKFSEFRKTFLILTGCSVWYRVSWTVDMRHKNIEFDDMFKSGDQIVNNIQNISGK